MEGSEDRSTDVLSEEMDSGKKAESKSFKGVDIYKVKLDEDLKVIDMREKFQAN